MAVFNGLLRARSSVNFPYVRRVLSSSAISSSEADLLVSSSSASSLDQNPLPLGHNPNGRNVQWVFLGCPGVGKGTYASRLSNLLGVPHIATGDLVREEASSSGPLASQVCWFLGLFLFLAGSSMLLLLICMNWMGLIRFVLTGEVSPTTNDAVSEIIFFHF